MYFLCCSRQSGKGKEASGGLQAALSQYSVDEQRSNLLTRRGSDGHYLTAANKAPSFHNDRRRAASPIIPYKAPYQQQQRPGTPKLFANSLIIPPIDPPNVVRLGQQRSISIHRPIPNKTRERSSSVGGPSSQYSILSVSRSPPSNAGLFSSTPGGGPKLYSQSPPKLTSPNDRSIQSRALGKSPTFSGTPPKASNMLKERSGSPSLRSAAKERLPSPGRGNRRERSGYSKSGGRESPHGSVKTPISRRKKAFNPFRQSDEDEVLAKRSHNRRRWSHVYPVGEVEFKRHAGPIWNSLTSPAILPLSVDHFPTQQELKDENSFQFSFYTVTLGGNEKKNYEKHADLLREMVRQRVTQDFQIVTDAAISESFKRGTELQREGK